MAKRCIPHRMQVELRTAAGLERCGKGLARGYLADHWAGAPAPPPPPSFQALAPAGVPAAASQWRDVVALAGRKARWFCAGTSRWRTSVLVRALSCTTLSNSAVPPSWRFGPSGAGAWTPCVQADYNALYFFGYVGPVPGPRPAAAARRVVGVSCTHGSGR